MTRSRHSARPMAMRSESRRGFCNSSRAAWTTGLRRSSSGMPVIASSLIHAMLHRNRPRISLQLVGFGSKCSRAPSRASPTEHRITWRAHRLAVAYVFPGQGSQTVGMGRLLSSHSPAAAAVFAEADDVLGQPLSRLCWEGPGPTLDLTINAQPALLASSIALLRALREDAAVASVSLEAPAFFAGHSMGQYSAMVAAGVLSLADGLRLVRRRGELMQSSSEDGSMAAIIGLDDARIPELFS